ncbi:hypothetical protein AJ79_02211 [Helicocarpus griseus UAMH5409]|uniref:Peptidase S54 rhomboid domain-containing protein n=1 Tax=Helicocarpus griseus UAMH5409 TaxID=1447875 RepID=A0A2B7Y3K9_9EURO|nr:hypothetical protein AJ79_02211 [Helicocarpus griseus UAMH5409]
MGIRSAPTPHAASRALLRALIPDNSQSYAVRCMSSSSRNTIINHSALYPIKPTEIFQSCLSRPFASTTFPAARSKTPRTPAPLKSNKRDDGIRFRNSDLSATEISQIFGQEQIPVPLANRMLRILQERRVSGTIDVDLPADIKDVVSEEVTLTGLDWLREKYPMDEDAAILKRIEREAKEEEQRLIRRGQELGLYKPQSGVFDKPVEKEGDVYGRSLLKEERERNEQKFKEEQERKNREWLEGEERDRAKLMESVQKSKELQMFQDQAVVEAQPRADPVARPALAWIQKHHIRATSHDWDTSKLTKAGRILPSLAIALLTMGLCYILAENYQPAPREQRMMPNTPPAAATVLGLIGINTLIFVLWRAFPPAWRMLNRYFVSVPLYPYSTSIVGSVFSHQQFKHLGTNMFILWFVGTRLHEELGRADFLSLYLSSGVLASLTSLTAHVLQNNLTVSSLGASGAIAGLLAAWCMIHADDKLTLIFLPQSWQETFSANGSMFLAAIALVEIVSLMALPFRSKAPLMDHWSHLGGYVAGGVVGWLWKEGEEERRKGRIKKEGLLGFLFGGGSR